MDFNIPVVDFSSYALDVTETDVKQESLQSLAEQICTAFRNVGFVYLKNHGLPQTQIDEVNQNLSKFVMLPKNVKSKFARRDNGYGWLGVATEMLNNERPHDLKETFSYLPQFENTISSTETAVPGMVQSFSTLFQLGHTLGKRVLHVMGIGLNITDPYFFCKQHNPDTEDNLTALRALYYPALTQYKDDLKPSQIRCGEHSDWGSITLLCQDDAGGLEVMNRQGHFVPAHPIPGTILVNVGDLMERWTDGELKSTVHRVLLPKCERTENIPRQSVAFFCIPDDNCEIKSLKGYNQNPPINTKDYMHMKMTAAVY